MCERCLKLVCLGKVFGTVYFVQGVWKWSVWERRFELFILRMLFETVSLEKAFETGQFAKGV